MVKYACCMLVRPQAQDYVYESLFWTFLSFLAHAAAKSLLNKKTDGVKVSWRGRRPFSFSLHCFEWNVELCLGLMVLIMHLITKLWDSQYELWKMLVFKAGCRAHTVFKFSPLNCLFTFSYVCFLNLLCCMCLVVLII